MISGSATILFFLTFVLSRATMHPDVIGPKKGQTEHHAWQFLPPFSVIPAALPIGHRLYSAMHAASHSRHREGRTQAKPRDCLSTITCSNNATALSVK